MPKYLNEYEVTSTLTLSQGTPSVEFKPPSALFRASVSEVMSEGETAKLFLRIFLEAKSIDDAEQKGKNYSSELVQALAIATAARFERPTLKRIIDWSPDIELRQAAVFVDGGQLSNPHPVLDQKIADGVSDMLQGELRPHVRSALGWYRDGILGLDPDKKVQAFWLALETLVGGMQWLEKVADKCKKCQTDLYCKTCKTISKHKPFPAQKIRLLLREVINDNDTLFNKAVEARHTLMHGGTLIGPINGNPFPYSEMIESLARASRKCVMREVMATMPKGASIRILEPSTYLHKTFQFKSHCFVTVPLQNGHLLPENIPKMNVTLFRENGGFVLKHSAIGEELVDIQGVEQGESLEGDDG